MAQTESKSNKLLVRELLSLSIYRGVLKCPATSLLLALLRAAARGDEDAVCDGWGQLCALLTQNGQRRSLPAAIAAEALADENAFVVQLAAGSESNIPEALTQLARRDLAVLYRAAMNGAEWLIDSLDAVVADCLPRWDNSPAAWPLDRPWHECVDKLGDYHRHHGVGRFALHTAFLWHDGAMVPVGHPDPIRLTGLKSYEAQRRIVVDNTRAFLDGFEANNVLLYGDRGTGKSSTVKALLNEYTEDGLRMIEMPKESLRDLPVLTAQLAAIPMKFIIFIDDLSFSSGDDNFAALKAVLEGGLAARPDNVLIYATSNRRHLLRETFSDRNGDEVHRADTVQEAVSLSDRFGIFLTFLMPDKQHFLDIVEQMAADRGLDVPRDALLFAAERWATERGGRSPRYARQFIADAQARLSRGEAL